MFKGQGQERPADAFTAMQVDRHVVPAILVKWAGNGRGTQDNVDLTLGHTRFQVINQLLVQYIALLDIDGIDQVVDCLAATNAQQQ